MSAIIIIIITITSIYGQVFLQGDQALICLSAVWITISNDVACKVFNIDDIKDMHSIYSDLMQERDTFDLEMVGTW
jgi:hypothetical protein